MRKRRAVAVGTIRVLLLTALLLCAINVMPHERLGSNYGKNRASMVAPVPAALSGPAAQGYSDARIAFSANDQICVMSPDGSNVTCLTSSPPGVFNRTPALSPNGKRIAFIRDDQSINDHALYTMGVDGSDLQRLTSSSVALGEPAWSPDGSKIAFVRGYDTTYGGYANITSCGQEIYVIDVASGMQVSLTKGDGGTDPAWSPDGTYIAFSSARDGNYEIYKMTSDGSEVKRLTENDWADAEPSWSPDGKQIAYAAHLIESGFLCGFMPTPRPASADEFKSSVYVMNADGTEPTMVDRTTGGIDPVWSPDSTSLALVIYSRGEWQIYVTDASGMSLTRLTSDPTQKSSPSWVQARRSVR